MSPASKEKGSGAIVFIRHGHDEPHGGHVFDERLSSEGKAKCRQAAKDLVRKYGPPTIIYYSPFQRCRATLREFLRVVNSYHKLPDNHEVKIIVAPALGKYFTSEQRLAMKSQSFRRGALRKSTERIGSVLIDKNKRKFIKRVKKHVKKCRSDLKEKSEEGVVIWNICHAVVLRRAAKICHRKVDDHVEYLQHVKIKQ